MPKEHPEREKAGGNQQPTANWPGAERFNERLPSIRHDLRSTSVEQALHRSIAELFSVSLVDWAERSAFGKNTKNRFGSRQSQMQGLEQALLKAGLAA